MVRFKDMLLDLMTETDPDPAPRSGAAPGCTPSQEAPLPFAGKEEERLPLLLAWRRLLFGHCISTRANVNSWAQPSARCTACVVHVQYMCTCGSPREATHGLSLMRWSQLVLRAWHTVAARQLARGRSEDGLLEAHLIEAGRLRAASEVVCLKKEKPLDYHCGADKEIAELMVDLKEREDSLKNTAKELATHEVRSACHATTAAACSRCPTRTCVATSASLVITPSLTITPGARGQEALG